MGTHRKAFMALSAFPDHIRDDRKSGGRTAVDGKYQFPAGEWSTMVSACHDLVVSGGVLTGPFRAWAVLMAVIVIGILSGYGRHIGSFLVLSRTLSFGPFFWIGYYLTEDQVRSFRSWKGRWLMAVLALFLAVVTAVESNGALKELFPIVYGMNYGRIGTLWSPASALVRFCAYGAAGIMILGVMAVVPRQRRVWTCLGERSLQIYILHRPIRDLMEAAGFYRAVTSRSRMTVVFVMAFSVALAICLSAPRITKLFRYVQDAPEKMFRLIGQNRF